MKIPDAGHCIAVRGYRGGGYCVSYRGEDSLNRARFGAQRLANMEYEDVYVVRVQERGNERFIVYEKYPQRGVR